MTRYAPPPSSCDGRSVRWAFRFVSVEGDVGMLMGLHLVGKALMERGREPAFVAAVA